MYVSILYAFVQDSTENQLYWVDFLFEYYNYNYNYSVVAKSLSDSQWKSLTHYYIAS